MEISNYHLQNKHISMTEFLRKVRVAISPRNQLLKATLANGAVVYGKNRSGFGGRGIYVLRDKIEPEFTHFTSFLAPESVVVDVGANTGIYSIKAAQHLAGKGVVIAVEPFPDVLAALYKSVQANKFTNVRLRNFCAGERTNTGTLWMNSGKPHEFSLLQHDSAAPPLSSLVVALDDLFVWEGLTRFDFLKIDAEGAENEVLRGAAGVIVKYRPIIQAEITLTAITVPLPEYTTFHAPDSPNNVYIPNEHPKFEIARKLGWVVL
jgi:FkbM family methyltransferase